MYKRQLWSSEGLEELLQALKKEGVQATFFLTGTWLKSHPAAAKMILEQGHEIGNHTLNHANLLYLTEKEIKHEIDGFNEAAQEILEDVYKRQAVERAALLLNYFFHRRGKIVPGHGRGKKMLYPTANMTPSPHLVWPGSGVYPVSYTHLTLPRIVLWNTGPI